MLMLYVLHVNIFSILVLLSILMSLIRNKRPGHKDDPFFELMIILVMVNLALDIPNELLQGMNGNAVHVLLIVGNSLAYVLNVVTTMFWVVHVDHFIFRDNIRTRKYLPWTAIPVMVIILMGVINFFVPFLFEIGDDNVYSRGPLFMLMPALLYGYVVYTLSYIVYHKKRIKDEDLTPILMFPIFPIVGGTFQILFYGALTIWPSTVLSFLIFHLNLQAKMIQVDSLTGLYNKREFSRKIETLKPSRYASGQLAGIMIDIDHFKEINDTYGHDMGDKVLKALSDVMKKTFRTSDFMARLGGDEFAVLMEISGSESFEETVEAFNDAIKAFNRQGLIPVEFSVSIGARVFNLRNDGNIIMFMQELDRAMYAHKKR